MTTKNFGLLCYVTGLDKEEASASRITPSEIHLNIWEHDTEKAKGDGAFLDIGLMFKLDSKVTTQEKPTTIELIFPWKVVKEDLIDLSSTIATPGAIAAIFNENWAVTTTNQSNYVVSAPKSDQPGFALLSMDQDSWVEKSHNTSITDGGDPKNINVHSISINMQKLADRAGVALETVGKSHQIDRLYIRFRVLNIRQYFYCVGVNDQSLNLVSVLKEEIVDIDFRLNVRRGAPPRLEQDLGIFVEFSKIHLFLMHSRDKNIIYCDKLFKAARALEDEGFWAHYSQRDPTKEGGRSNALKKNRKRIKKSLGYQWKSEGNNQKVKEFNVLARFKMVEVAIGRFIFFALILGIVGSVIGNFLTNVSAIDDFLTIVKRFCKWM